MSSEASLTCVAGESAAGRTTLSPIDRLAAGFFGIPPEDISRLQTLDWIAHKAVVTFVVWVVLPLSAVSFGHLMTLILASGAKIDGPTGARVYWASAIGGAAFGVIVTWLNDSGMTLMLRRTGASWQKAIGLLTRTLFIALNVVVFTSAITAFSLRDVIAATRSHEQRESIESGTKAGGRDLQVAWENVKTSDEKIEGFRQDFNKQQASQQKLAARHSQCLRELSALRNELDAVTATRSSGPVPKPEPLKNAADATDPRPLQLEKLGRKSTECNALKSQHAAVGNTLADLERLRSEQQDLRALAFHRYSQLSAVQASNEQAVTTEATHEYGRNVGAEFSALATILADEADPNARAIAIIVALFFAMIDITPIIWGWSLQGGAVDEYCNWQARSYRRRLAAAEERAVDELRLQRTLNTQHLDAREGQEKKLRRRRARADAEIAAAKHYADAVSKLDRMLASEHYTRTDAETKQRIRLEAIECLSASFRFRTGEREG